MSKLLNLIIILQFSIFKNENSFDKFNDSNNIKNKKGEKNIKELINFNNINQRKLDEYNTIRIYIDKSYLEKHLIDNERLFKIYSYSLDKSKNTLEKLIKVKREDEIKFPEIFMIDNYENFNKRYIDNNLLTGIKADLVILVREALYNELENGCFEKPKILKRNDYGRPIVGYIIINPDLYKDSDDDIEYKKELYSSNFLHQFTHILGFTRKDLINNGINIMNIIISIE